MPFDIINYRITESDIDHLDSLTLSEVKTYIKTYQMILDNYEIWEGEPQVLKQILINNTNLQQDNEYNEVIKQLDNLTAFLYDRNITQSIVAYEEYIRTHCDFSFKEESTT